MGPGRGLDTCLVVTDDLTGANAVAARFAVRGLRALTLRWGVPPRRALFDYDVVVVDTGTRHTPPTEAARRVQMVVARWGSRQLVAKRVDTTLRGNVAVEAQAALESLRRTSSGSVRALMVPAHPSGGRVTVDGRQLFDGTPIDESAAAHTLGVARSSRVADLFTGTDLAVGEVDIGTVGRGGSALVARLREPVDLLVCDAADDGHLRQIAAAAAVVARTDDLRWLPVDPGPFTDELHRATESSLVLDPDDPVLVVAGSTTDLTRGQLTRLERHADARILTVDPDGPDAGSVASQLLALLTRDGKPRVVGMRTTSPRSSSLARASEVARFLGDITARVLRKTSVSGLYLTGGDVASAVITAIGGEGMEVHAEVLPLAVVGSLRGGAHDGLPIVTKGGLVGTEDAAVRCVAVLSRSACQSNREKRVPDASS